MAMRRRQLMTQRSLLNKRRRFPELRKVQGRLRSLRRSRFARQVCSRRLGVDLAVVKLFFHTGEFLECSFSSYTGEHCPVKLAKERMLRALHHISSACMQASLSNSSVDLSAIRVFGSAATNLYQTTRREKISDDCDEVWVLIGLCYHTIFKE